MTFTQWGLTGYEVQYWKALHKKSEIPPTVVGGYVELLPT
jgi:hypothetical protein